MCAGALLLLAALPALAGSGAWSAGGEVVSVAGGTGSAGGAGGGAGGAGPAFAPEQHTAVVAPLGEAATLECRVLRLRDKSVSWVRSRDLQILSHAGAVFTADARVSASSAAAVSGSAAVPGSAVTPGSAAVSLHTLHIEHLRSSDGGRYECQVNTEPKMSLFFNLTVVDEPVPAVEVAALGAATVRGARGDTATLACEARYWPPPRALPLPPLDVRWHKDHQPISLQGGRGGVSLDTQRWAWRVTSRLTLAGLAPRDAGRYWCRAGNNSVAITLQLYGDEDHAEAMQRDEAASAAPPLPRPAPALAPASARAAALALAALLALRHLR